MGLSQQCVKACLIWSTVATILTLTIGLYLGLGGDPGCFWFLLLFLWRYTRFVANPVGYFCYKPVPKPAEPTYRPCKDVTVILPTIDPLGDDFKECLETCAANMPNTIIIVTAGDQLLQTTMDIVQPITYSYPLTQFVVKASDVASKRAQVGIAVPLIRTSITVLLDDHVFWKPDFLKSLLDAFEEPNVGQVATNKLVRRLGGSLWHRYWNMLGALYLERHNFEIRATNAIDGGVFVVSGRTCGIRTEILQHPSFLPVYLNEKFFFGKFGPLNAGDDNFITRFVVREGWDIKVHFSDATCIETTIGVVSPVVKKYLGQCTRWVRTTWRSNPCSLFTDGTVWYRQPYCVYAVYLSSFTNFALIIDPLLFYLLTKTVWYKQSSHPWLLLIILGVWILFTKCVKVAPYFLRHPQDLFLFPGYLLFAYFHSFIKLYAMVTFWNCSWGGRNLDAAVNVEMV